MLSALCRESLVGRMSEAIEGLVDTANRHPCGVQEGCGSVGTRPSSAHQSPFIMQKIRDLVTLGARGGPGEQQSPHLALPASSHLWHPGSRLTSAPPSGKWGAQRVFPTLRDSPPCKWGSLQGLTCGAPGSGPISVLPARIPCRLAGCPCLRTIMSLLS